MSIPFVLHTERLFRETPAVHFADIGIDGTNGLDLVTHKGQAVSPPYLNGVKQFYLHYHQTDHNRCLSGSRIFELVNFSWDVPHWFIYLTPELGALEIPVQTFHRSYSCADGSILINQAKRDSLYNEDTEFVPTRPSLGKCPPPSYYNCTRAEAEHFIKHGRLK